VYQAVVSAVDRAVRKSVRIEPFPDLRSYIHVAYLSNLSNASQLSVTFLQNISHLTNVRILSIITLVRKVTNYFVVTNITQEYNGGLS
jgi:hypothetical protein